MVYSKNIKQIILNEKEIKRMSITSKGIKIKNKFNDSYFIKLKLNNKLIHKYNIYYRTYTTKYKWTPWTYNGNISGVNKYNIEIIDVRLYEKMDQDQNKLNIKTSYIKYPKYTPTYYKQKDKRWKNKQYGDYKIGGTGCAPTAMAMAFTGILDKKILPTDVANYLYYHTKEYNYKTSGTSGKAIILAAKHFNIKETPLMNKYEIKKALKRGKIVYAAMGNGTYGTKKYNHAIIFYGFKNNMTKVYDPLKKSNNKNVTIEKLWKEQSKDYDDHNGISNFYSLEKK